MKAESAGRERKKRKARGWRGRVKVRVKKVEENGRTILGEENRRM